MDISIAIDPWLVIVLLGCFIALRVWHPITAFAGRRKTKQTTAPKPPMPGSPKRPVL